MNTFAAESAAWRIKVLGDEIVADAINLARAVRDDANSDEMARRVTALRKFTVAVERAADEFEAALRQMETAQ